MNSKHYKLDNLSAVIGELAKRLQIKYGNEALSIFREVLEDYGYQCGTKLRGKMLDLSFPDRVTGWLNSFFENGQAEVVEKKSDRVTVKGFKCPLNLEGSNRVLCEALTMLDVGLVRALAEEDITLKIEKSLSCGDECCLATFALKH
jgi:hypothetical protein